MSKQYKMAVVIGRFQPFHNQHAELVLKARELADNVTILIGGDKAPRTPKNPFTTLERAWMIRDWAKTVNMNNDVLAISGIQDFPYSDATWASAVQTAVEHHANDEFDLGAKPEDIVVVGCNKDESSFYLKMFPQWKLHEEPYKEHIDATQIRELLYDDRSMDFISGAVPEATMHFLRQFRPSEQFKYVLNERTVIERYKKSWEAAPYAPTFVTADAVVICSGHILLVERGAAPGQGLVALPGGFVNQNERLVDAVIRELREETKLKVPDPVLRGSIRESKIFDAPGRSSRGRTITNASLIVLPDGQLPKVKGSDDAAKAMWVPLGELKPEEFFEDHFSIIEYFKARV